MCNNTYTRQPEYNNVIFSAGALGVVHKGELMAAPGAIKAVAIKTIKCKQENLTQIL